MSVALVPHAPSPVSTSATAPSTSHAPSAISFNTVLDHLLDRGHLRPAQAQALMDNVLAGDLGPERLAAFIVAVRAKPLDAAELAGFARSMLAHAHAFPRPPGPLLDTCGTGASRLKTFNVSTCVAFVAAAAGIRVAKHGNRSVTRPNGSSDLLDVAGVDLGMAPGRAATLLHDTGITFLHAPTYHPAMVHAAPVRKALGIRTVFNLLGPLANPAAPTHHVLGVHDVSALRPMAEALALMGCGDGYVLHGSPGMDEATPVGTTHALRITAGHVGRPLAFEASDFGCTATLDDLRPVPREEALTHARNVLAGRHPAAQAVALNAAFALEITGHAADIQQGYTTAMGLLESGAALAKFEAFRTAAQ